MSWEQQDRILWIHNGRTHDLDLRLEESHTCTPRTIITLTTPAEGPMAVILREKKITSVWLELRGQKSGCPNSHSLSTWEKGRKRVCWRFLYFFHYHLAPWRPFIFISLNPVLGDMGNWWRISAEEWQLCCKSASGCSMETSKG